MIKKAWLSKLALLEEYGIFFAKICGHILY
jgi:hypothetical protein